MQLKIKLNCFIQLTRTQPNIAAKSSIDNFPQLTPDFQYPQKL